MGEFKEKFRRVDALILDDVQFLAGRERTQRSSFHTFNSLHNDRHQIVLTSDKVPPRYTGPEDRLRTGSVGIDRRYRAGRISRRGSRSSRESGRSKICRCRRTVALYVAQERLAMCAN